MRGILPPAESCSARGGIHDVAALLEALKFGHMRICITGSAVFLDGAGTLDISNEFLH